MATTTTKRREAPLLCKCKEGRCVECRLCPRKSCKVNCCVCPAGPTRLRVPKKRKLGEIIADSSSEGTMIRRGGGVTVVTTTMTNSNNDHLPPAPHEDAVDHNNTNTNMNPYLEAFGEASPPAQPDVVVLPSDLQDKVLRYKPLEFPEDVVEALQLPERQIMSRFQRRRIAKDGIESLQTAFEKQCCKRTVQTFQDGVQRLAQLLLPEAPDYLLQMLPLMHHPRVTRQPTQVEVLKQVIQASPRKSIQARTARAVLAAALPQNETNDVMTKYARKIALKDWSLLKQGQVLLAENKTEQEMQQQQCRESGKRKSANETATLPRSPLRHVGASFESSSAGRIQGASHLGTAAQQTFAASTSTTTAAHPEPTNSQLTMAQEAMLAMMRTMPATSSNAHTP